MDLAVLEMRGVGKAYGRNPLFRHVDLTLRRGGCVALTGRNGAGKTTLLRIAGGMAAASEGTVRRGKGLSIGYVPENFPRVPMTARQFLRHLGAIEGHGPGGVEAAGRLFEAFFMGDLADLPMSRLSKGTLQKVAVIQALMRPRGLLLLDEPLSGQDDTSQRVFVEQVLAAKRAGAAVLLSCHEPFLVETLADTACLVSRDGLLPARFGAADGPCALMGFEPDQGASIPEGLRCERRGGRLYVTAPIEECDRIIPQMIQRGYSLREMCDEDSL